MPTIIDEAVCVRHWDWSETSQTVSLLTREHGMLRGIAKGSKRERGRFSGGIDLLTRGQIVAIVKPGRELSTLTDWDLHQTFRALRDRIEANRAAFYMAELVCRMVSDADPHPRVFDAFTGALGTLGGPMSIPRSLAAFQWILLDECGFRPRLRLAHHATESEVPVVSFDPRAGGVVAGRPNGSWAVRRSTLAFLEQLDPDADNGTEVEATEPPEGSAASDVADSERRAARLLAAVIRDLLGTEPITLRAVFGELPVPTR